ncbi:MAG: glycosyltransferase [Gaiellaceae bacterium]
MAELAFVVSPRQNRFFTDLVAALRFELDALGVPTVVCDEGFGEPRDDRVYILLPPHEYRKLEPQRWPGPGALRRTIFVCAEQPGTPFFEDDVALAPQAGAVFDISRTAVRELERRGVAARHLQLGYSAAWDRSQPGGTRDVDVLFLGSHSPRRVELLAGYARSLSRWRSALILSDNSGPNDRTSESFLAGEAKWSLLGRSRTLLNVHQGEPRYLEWLRLVEAISNGCAVVSEESVDVEPLAPGVHFVTGRAETLALLAVALLEQPERREAMASEARGFLRDELPLRSAAEGLAETAEQLGRRPISAETHPTPPPAEPPFRRAPFQPIPDTADPDMAAIRAAVKELTLDARDLRRRFTRAEVGPRPGVEVSRMSAGFKVAGPRVSVLTALYDQEAHIAGALGSLLGGTFTELELIVVDDGSTDGGGGRVAEWIAAHEHVPAMLVTHPVNRGLPQARNTALGFARGDYALVLDADNELLPHGLQRLVDACDANPDAVFAYGMLERFGTGAPLGLTSEFPWQPERLRGGNYIDAFALVRTPFLRSRGGFTTDRRLHGWEDYDLWCDVAERGERGAFVPEIVGRYRVSPLSMLSLTNLSTTVAFSVLAERYTRLFAGREQRSAMSMEGVS